MATVLKGRKKGMSGSLSYSGSKLVYSERHTYVVISDTIAEAILTVLATSGLPRVMIDSITGTYGACLCTGLDPKQDDQNPYVWYVDAMFTTDIEGQETEGDGIDSADPLTWVPRYKGSFEFVPQVLYEDFSDPPKPYLNSAGDKFPEPLIYRRPCTVYDFWQIEDNSATDEEIGDRTDTVNSTTFRTFEAGKLKLQVSGFERGFWYGVDAVRIEYRVAYNKKGWLIKPADAGYAYRPSAGQKKVASDALVFLNTDGTAKAESVTEPDYLEFKGHEQIDFNDFLR